MATLKAIRKRISSVRNTQQITKAMKMVSAAKLRRAQEAAVAARPYAEKMTELLKNVAARVAIEAHPLLQTREEKKIDLVLFTSDRGLCGGYNANLIRAAEAFIRRHVQLASCSHCRPAMAKILFEVIEEGPKSPMAKSLMVTPPFVNYPGFRQVQHIVFSGGVSEHGDRRHRSSKLSQ